MPAPIQCHPYLFDTYHLILALITISSNQSYHLKIVRKFVRQHGAFFIDDVAKFSSITFKI